MTWIIIAIIMMAGLGYWNHLRTQDQQQLLQNAGFQISQNLKGTPTLLISESQGQLAVVRGGGYLRLDFDQVTATSIRYSTSASDDRNYRIHITLRNASEPSVDVAYENEFKAESARKQLNQILGL